MRRFLSGFIDLGEGEVGLDARTTLTLFGLIAAHTLLETARDALFLEKLSAGAARAAMRASVATWADEILGRVDPGPRNAPSGVYNAW